MSIDVVAVIAATAAQQARRRRSIEKAESAWGAYAKLRQLNYEQARGWLRRDWPRLEGERHGVQVALEVVTRATQWDYGTACVAVLQPNAAGTLEVVREGIASRIGVLLGGKDIIIGDDAFDRAFIIDGDPEGAAERILTPPTRKALTELQVERFTYGEVGEAGTKLVTAEFLGIVDDHEKLDQTLKFLASLVDR